MGHFIRCDCGSEGLYIDEDEGEVYISLFYCSPYQISIRHKLNWIWQILKGKPYKDCIIISTSQAKDFIKIMEKW